jgi:hypothetical protein
MALLGVVYPYFDGRLKDEYGKRSFYGDSVLGYAVPGIPSSGIFVGSDIEIMVSQPAAVIFRGYRINLP